MLALRSIPALLALLAGLAPRFAQDHDGYTSSLTAAQDRLTRQLEELAVWCTRRTLLAEADTTYRQILVLDPEHEQARRSLRYRLRRGVWVQSASYRRPRNHSQDALDELAREREATLGAYKRFVFELNRTHSEDTSLEARERTLRHLLQLLPEDPEVRAALGEARVDGEWALLETSRARKSRKYIPELASTCLATAPAGQPDEANALERMLGLKWRAILSTPYLRVAGTGDPAEVANVLRATHGAGELFRTLLRNDTLPQVGFAIYLLAGTGEKRQFLDNHPGVKPADRPFLESLQSAGIPKTGQTVEWSETEVQRLDRSVRQTIGKMMTDTFGITLDHGWAWEGFGIYLTYQLVGTRLTYYARPERYGANPNAATTQRQLLKRMYTSGADWMDEARLFFAEHPPPRLNFLMARKVDALSAQDLLWSYVLAAYFLEGWPDETPEFLRGIGEGLRPQEASRAAFGMELGRIEDRVVRWLRESR